MERKSVSTLFDLTGKGAIVTGGVSGLGHDMATALAEAGAKLVLTSRSLEKAQEVAEKFSKEYGCECYGLKLDQTDFQNITECFEKANELLGGIDILISNAGGGSGKAQGDLILRDAQVIADMIHLNLTGSLLCCKEAAKYMIERRYGKIITIGSIAAVVGRDREIYLKNEKMQQPIDYAAAKGGVVGMTRDLAAYLAPYGVFANCISPGGFDNSILPQGFIDDYAEKTMTGHMGRIGSDIKGAAVFLASAASDYVTGHNLVVDGGFSVFK